MSELPGQTVAEAFQLYRTAAQMWDRSIKEQGKVPLEVVSQVYKCAELVLRAYCRPENLINGIIPKETIPIELAAQIASQIHYIVAGSCPGPIADLTGRGTPGIGPHEGYDIGIAVAFIKLVKGGEIKERAPVKYVAQLFKVVRGSVRRWQRKYHYVEPNDFFPNVSDEIRIGLITDELKRAALRYRNSGRGAKGRADRHRMTNPAKKPLMMQHRGSWPKAERSASCERPTAKITTIFCGRARRECRRYPSSRHQGHDA
jgi:hypothetical protein